ncbi:hypothetical protein P3T23_002463 [Paraburkholderia sp. GAS448]
MFGLRGRLPPYRRWITSLSGEALPFKTIPGLSMCAATMPDDALALPDFRKSGRATRSGQLFACIAFTSAAAEAPSSDNP